MLLSDAVRTVLLVAMVGLCIQWHLLVGVSTADIRKHSCCIHHVVKQETALQRRFLATRCRPIRFVDLISKFVLVSFWLILLRKYYSLTDIVNVLVILNVKYYLLRAFLPFR